MGSRMVSMFHCSVQQLKVEDVIPFRPHELETCGQYCLWMHWFLEV